jgi:hypothetical protein
MMMLIVIGLGLGLALLFGTVGPIGMIKFQVLLCSWATFVVGAASLLCFVNLGIWRGRWRLWLFGQWVLLWLVPVILGEIFPTFGRTQPDMLVRWIWGLS